MKTCKGIRDENDQKYLAKVFYILKKKKHFYSYLLIERNYGIQFYIILYITFVKSKDKHCENKRNFTLINQYAFVYILHEKINVFF